MYLNPIELCEKLQIFFHLISGGGTPDTLATRRPGLVISIMIVHHISFICIGYFHMNTKILDFYTDILNDLSDRQVLIQDSEEVTNGR